MKRPSLPALLLFCLVPRGVAAQAHTASFQVTPEETRATVGDSVTLRFRVRLDERDLLLDTVPRPIGPVPDGVRVLSVEKMHRTADRIFHGGARLAFYRPGRQAAPVFGVPFMRIVEGVRQATLASDSSFINVIPVLPPGNPALKDIQELEPRSAPPWGALAAAILLVVTLLLILRRLRRSDTPEPVLPRAHEPDRIPGADPFIIALEALSRIEREQWPAHAETARHYEAVVDVLRDYLESAEALPARERTTAEVVWALPPHLSQTGLRERFHQLLNEADSVKFARARPSVPAARRFLEQCRSLLTHWHAARTSDQPADAIR
jgi:hypothetical protein